MPRLRKRPLTDHRESAAMLRAEPGVWLHINTYAGREVARSIAGAIRSGGNCLPGMYLPAGAFEAYTEMVDEGTAVYARYTG